MDIDVQSVNEANEANVSKGDKAADKGKGRRKPRKGKTTPSANVSIDSIAKSPKLTADYIDKLLKTLADDKTTKIDKKTVRRFLRQLGHRGGLRSSKYSTSKSIADFVK